jgi:hypothetical protein
LDLINVVHRGRHGRGPRAIPNGPELRRRRRLRTRLQNILTQLPPDPSLKNTIRITRYATQRRGVTREPDRIDGWWARLKQIPHITHRVVHTTLNRVDHTMRIGGCATQRSATTGERRPTRTVDRWCFSDLINVVHRGRHGRGPGTFPNGPELRRRWRLRARLQDVLTQLPPDRSIKNSVRITLRATERRAATRETRLSRINR